MIKTFRYCMYGRAFANITKHPQQDMIDRGFHWVECEPVPVADCWIFKCDIFPKKIPDYITEMEYWQE